MNRSKTLYVFLFLCITIACALRYFVLLNTQHLDGESIVRIIFSCRFSENPWKLLSGVKIIEYGTGGQQWYYFLNALLIHIFDHPIFISRLSSLIFGLLVIIPYYLLVKSSFPVPIAICSTLSLCFYVVHIQLSVSSMANAGYILFVVLAFLFLTLYFSSEYKKRVYFWSSIIFTILATSFRLEAWILVIIFPSFLLSQRKKRDALIFLILSSLYIFKTLLSFYQTREPFGFLRNSLINPDFSHKGFTFLTTRPDMPLGVNYQFSVWVFTLIYTLSPFIFFLGLTGMYCSSKDKRQLKFLILFWSFFLLLTVRQIMSNQYPYIRYSAILAIFFIPFAFLGTVKIIKNIHHFLGIKLKYKNSLTYVGLAIITVYFTVYSLRLLNKEIPKMQYNKFIIDLANLIRENCREGDIIISSLDSLTLGTGITLNGYICTDILSSSGEEERLYINFEDDRTYEFYDYISKNKISQKLYKRIAQFIIKCHLNRKGENINVRLITKRRGSREVKRFIFILDDYDFTYLKANFPDLYKNLIMIKKYTLGEATSRLEEIWSAVLKI